MLQPSQLTCGWDRPVGLGRLAGFESGRRAYVARERVVDGDERAGGVTLGSERWRHWAGQDWGRGRRVPQLRLEMNYRTHDNASSGPQDFTLSSGERNVNGGDPTHRL